jgi:phenylacetate-coenzyme A ligase PaaK-like adenylate-forming protein
MTFIKRFKKELFSVNSDNFENYALQAFQFQAENNPVYSHYISLLSINPKNVKQLEEIPFLPIEFFKSHKIRSVNTSEEVIFQSSGTTGQIRSKHYVSDLEFYHMNCRLTFYHFYGNLKDYNILALLPSYLEREGSSLVEMVDDFIKVSGAVFAGFYLNNRAELINNLKTLKAKGEKVLLIGVTFALLDLAEEYNIDLSGCIIMETGGMKGRREELIREQVHDIIKASFNVGSVHSEYGMTELLSQGYSQGDGIFSTPPWMKVMVRDAYDPFDLNPVRGSGGLNVIDLANIESCCFIETKDLGQVFKDGKFTVSGRYDASDVRGCNLLIS